MDAVTEPEPEVLAAIVAAVEATWPRPGPDVNPDVEPSRWRFSARWWSRPAASRRTRPW